MRGTDIASVQYNPVEAIADCGAVKGRTLMLDGREVLSTSRGKDGEGHQAGDMVDFH